MTSNWQYESTPLIVIIGATGCGKTKLSIELAKHYNGQIISADSMQVYKGLDIVTNKVTISEQQQIPHYIIDQIDPFEQFTVLDFQAIALKSIHSIISQGKFPIVVGGTNYYIESILWDTLVGAKLNYDEENFPMKEEFCIISEDKSLDIKTIEDLFKHKIIYRNLSSVPDEILHQFLMKIDPQSAQNLHVHNRRKVIRCLQVFQQFGRKMSDILEEQRAKGSRHGGPLRFKNSIILWVDCEKNALEKRLDDRVDEMIRQGLIEELIQFHQNYNNRRLKQNMKTDYTEGIFQTIGLKEFHEYLLMTEEERTTYEGQLKLGYGIIMLKQRTKSYANKQLKWIKRRFLVGKNIRNVPNIYHLDSTDPELWTDKVRNQSIKIIDYYLQAISTKNSEESQQIWTEILNPLSVEIKTESDDSFISGQFYCDICNISISGGISYRNHLNSKRHKHQVKQMKNFILQ